MTISRGAPWGRSVPRPDGLRLASDDAELVERLTDGNEHPTAVTAGDMWRTVGAADLGDRAEVNELPLDLLEVGLDDRVVDAVAHVVMRRPWHRGGWLRGPVIAVMNAEFFGDFDVAPRGHPNDGRVEVLELDSSMPARQRFAVRRRLRNGTHLPHPQIVTRSVRQVEYTSLGGLHVLVDGRPQGTVDNLVVRVRPDAAVLHA